jgi:hypothetical protein
MTALRAAALQQELMVAALTCHATADFNLFVTTYRDALLKTDRALKDFFLRQGASKGEDAYNAYKTRLANESSLRSLHDPRFCRSAKVVFDVALKRKGAVAELASERPTPVATGYAICSPGATETVVADAAPSPPPRRLALLDSPSSVPVPKLAPRPLRASPPVPPQRAAIVVADAAPRPAPLHRVLQENLPSLPVAKTVAPQDRVLTQGLPQRDARIALLPRGNADSPRDAEQLPARASHEIDAYDREADAQVADDVSERDDFDSDATDEDSNDADDAPRYVPRYAEAQPARAYGNVPDAFKPGAYWVHAYGSPARPRMVFGPDGHWYLLLYSGR